LAAKAWQLKSIPGVVVADLITHYRVLEEDRVQVPVVHLASFVSKVAVECLADSQVDKWVDALYPFSEDEQETFNIDTPAFHGIRLPEAEADRKAVFAKWSEGFFCEPLVHMLVDATQDTAIGPLKTCLVAFLTNLPVSPPPSPQATAWSSIAVLTEATKVAKGILALIDPVPYSHGQQPSDVEFVVGRTNEAGTSLFSSESCAIAKSIHRLMTKPDANGNINWTTRHR
jgi:hypothetical protein